MFFRLVPVSIHVEGSLVPVKILLEDIINIKVVKRGR